MCLDFLCVRLLEIASPDPSRSIASLSLRSSPEKRILDSTTVPKPLSFGVSRRAESPFRSRPSFSALLNPLRLCSVFSSAYCVKISECFLKF
ncbi:hypothetical protein NPIL_688881 [Nephila pilipes]|uniref:Uncharacterized protein n=1 Tax=Nephila pilipes TaxID=299642 RepID=A0A8X6TA73_NEPPI|nr:hypothetical protein NPIL_688881 [Nephila pilipes]